MNENRSPLHSSRAIPIGALLPFLVGVCLLISRFKYAPLLVEHGGTWVPITFSAVGVCLILWGITQFAVGLGKKDDEVVTRPTHRMRLPPQGIVYIIIMIVLFLGSLLGRSNMLMLVFSMMAGPFILNGWLSYSMLRKCRVDRHLPERAMVGEVISVGLTLNNGKRVMSSWLMAVRDFIRAPNHKLDSGVMFARVPPQDSRTSQYQLCPMQRGQYWFGPIEVTTRYPFGLSERSLILPSEDPMLVHPRVGRLTARWKNQQQHMAELLDRSEHQRGAYDDEFHRLREYRAGDNPRAIHWRASARQRELMVREYEQSRDRHLALVLDLWSPAEPDKEHRDRIELAISFACTVAIEQIRQNRATELSLAVVGREVTIWNAETGPVSLESLLDLMALIRPGDGAELSLSLHRLRASCPRQTRSVIISTRRELPDLTPPADPDSVAIPSNSREAVQHLYSDWGTLGSFFVLD